MQAHRRTIAGREPARRDRANAGNSAEARPHFEAALKPSRFPAGADQSRPAAAQRAQIREARAIFDAVLKGDAAIPPRPRRGGAQPGEGRRRMPSMALRRRAAVMRTRSSPPAARRGLYRPRRRRAAPRQSPASSRGSRPIEPRAIAAIARRGSPITSPAASAAFDRLVKLTPDASRRASAAGARLLRRRRRHHARAALERAASLDPATPPWRSC